MSCLSWRSPPLDALLSRLQDKAVVAAYGPASDAVDEPAEVVCEPVWDAAAVVGFATSSLPLSVCPLRRAVDHHGNRLAGGDGGTPQQGGQARHDPPQD